MAAGAWRLQDAPIPESPPLFSSLSTFNFLKPSRLPQLILVLAGAQEEVPHGEAGGGLAVEEDEDLGMELERASRAAGRDGTLHRCADRVGFSCSERLEEDAASLEDGSDAHGDRHLRLELALGVETPVVEERLGGQRLNAGPGVERRGGLVESDVPVR